MSERRFRRIPFTARVEVSTDRAGWSCALLDLAIQGALIETGERLPLDLGETCRLSILLQDSSIALDFQAELVHQEDGRYGFKFLSNDLETLTHLRKLIELNTGDSETTRHELAAWLKN